MEELIERLETQIRSLIERHDQLKQSNQQLHQGKYLVLREKELLAAKQQKAIVQIESLVTKLKSLEKQS